MTTGRPGKFGAVIRWGQSRLSKRSIVQGSRQEKSLLITDKAHKGHYTEKNLKTEVKQHVNRINLQNINKKLR
nr:MAG TPA: hypothetical protein [Caudoviricetes sp.]